MVELRGPKNLDFEYSVVLGVGGMAKNWAALFAMPYVFG